MHVTHLSVGIAQNERRLDEVVVTVVFYEADNSESTVKCHLYLLVQRL